MKLNELNFRKISLQNRIFAAMTAVVFFACLFMVFIVKNLLPPVLIEASKDVGELTAKSIAARSLEGILTECYSEIRIRINEEKKMNKKIHYIFVMDESFNVLAHTFSGGFPMALKMANEIKPHQDSSIRLLETDDGDIYDIAVVIAANSDTLGYVRIGLSDKHIQELCNRTLVAILWAGISAVLLASYLSFLLAGGIAKPIEAMHRASEDVIMGDFSGRVRTPPVPCREFRKCGEKECPAYEKNDLPCWCVSDTFCKEVRGKDYAQKIDFCRTCSVYKKYSGDAVQQLAETFNLLTHRFNDKFSQLSQSRKQYKELFDNAPIALWREDIAEVRKGIDALRREGVSDFEKYWREHPGHVSKCAAMIKVKDVNKATVELYKAKDKKDLLKGLAKVFTEEYYPVFVNQLIAISDGVGHFQMEGVNCKLTGEKMHLRVNWIFYGKSELILAVQDISVQKKTEKELIEKEKKLILALNVKEKFSAMVSHELRTPLSAIKEGLALMEGPSKEMNPEQKKLLGIAKRNIDRLHRLINDVLDFSKLESGGMKFRFKKNDMRKALKEAAKTYEKAFELKGLFLHTNFSKNLGACSFDYDKILQVIINLLDNALKWTEKGGITLSAAIDDEKKMLRISVKDTGKGLNKKEIDIVFRQYVQLPTGIFRKPGGTGLGLAISKEIVLAHGGNIWAESGQGKGTEFIFTLPMTPAGKEMK
ncbi:MAG: HAMP domain-containing histidine kinase [Elusimicrobia bacterium]|nr:HAMP domain-containing histidine kinase [Elusimicrobiota bacterium]